MKKYITLFSIILIFIFLLSSNAGYSQVMGGDTGGIVNFTSSGAVIDNVIPQTRREKAKKTKKDVEDEITDETVSDTEAVESTEIVEVDGGTKEITTFENGSVKETITKSDGTTVTVNISADKSHRTSVYQKGNYTTEIETVIEKGKNETKIITTAITTDSNGKLIAETTKEKVLDK